MRYIFILLAMALMTGSMAESDEFSSNIKEVTVFIRGAQITRSFSADLKTGTQTIKAIGLSPYIDPKTVQINGKGAFTILSIRHQINFIDEKKLNNEVKKIQDSLNYYTRRYSEFNNEVQVIHESQAILMLNRQVKGQEQMKVEDLKAVHDYIKAELSTIKKKLMEIEYAKADLSIIINKYRKQLYEINKKLATATSEVYIELNAKSNVKAEFVLSYLVSNVSWYPSYDVRVANINSPINLTYKANIQQNTGVDWENVKLTFSNANPYKSGDLPNLVPYRLNYASGAYRANPYSGGENSYGLNNWMSTSGGNIRGRVVGPDGQGIAYANVMVVGSSIGTTTNDQGYFDIALPQGSNQIRVDQFGYNLSIVNANTSGFNSIVLQPEHLGPLSEDRDGDGVSDYFDVEDEPDQERVYGNGKSTSDLMRIGIRSRKVIPAPSFTSKPVESIILQNQTSLNIEVEIPYTIESGGKMRTIGIDQYDINAHYEYRSVPKLEKAAFLIARVPDWSGYNLMEGEANLYYENTYIGKSILDVRFLTDTLNISLGRDNNVIISREKVKSTGNRQFLGSDKIEKREFEIKVKNNKAQKINLIIYDQVPISSRPKDIEVTIKEINGARHHLETGELRWLINLDPGQEFSTRFSYQVKFPKSQEINLE